MAPPKLAGEGGSLTKIQKERRRAPPRCFALLESLFLVLAVSLGSLAAHATPQGTVHTASPTPFTACSVTSIDTSTGVVTARDKGTGQNFRFLVKDSKLLNSLKAGLEVVADFKAQQVWTSAAAGGQRVLLGNILTDNFGKSPGGPAAGASQPDKIPQPTKAAQLAGPSGGGNLQPNQLLQPTNKTPGPPGAGGGTSPQPGKIAEPAGPAGGRNPLAKAGANLGGAASPAQSVSQIISINTARGVVAARVNSSGESFRFFVRDSALLSSLKEGEAIVADFNSQEVFTSAGASGLGVRLGSILTDPYGKSLGGPSAGTNATGPIGTGRPAASGSPSPGEPPKTESALVPPPGSTAGRGTVGPTVITAAPPQIQNFGVFPGPIPGGQKDVGQVELTGVPANGATVQLSSNQPQVASVPAQVQVSGSGPSAGSAVIEVNTSPVTQATDVTLSAQVVGSSQVSTTKLTVRPPQVSILVCSPGTFTSGMPISCKVWLDGAVASTLASRTSAVPVAPNPAGAVQISTNNSQVASIPGGAISVPEGAFEAEFQVPTTAYPEPVDVVITASSQGSTPQSASVRLTAAAIRSIACSPCEVVGGAVLGGGMLGIAMNFSGPTPAGFITLSSSSPLTLYDGNRAVPLPAGMPLQGGQTQQFLQLMAAAPVAVPTTVTLSATDPLSTLVKTVQVTIDPPSPTRVEFPSGSSISNVLAGGQQVTVFVLFNANPPDAGITFNVNYSASDAAGNPLQGAITGPSQITVNTSNVNQGVPGFPHIFGVTVQPCEVNAPCKVSVTVGPATGTLSVSP